MTSPAPAGHILDALAGRRRLTWGKQPLCSAIPYTFEIHARQDAKSHRRRHKNCTVRIKQSHVKALGADITLWVMVARRKKEYAD